MSIVSVDAVMTNGNAGTSPYVGGDQGASAATTISSTGITVTGRASLLLGIGIWGTSGTVSPSGFSMSWNGVAMTRVGTGVDYNNAGGWINHAEMFYLINPAAGAQTLSCSWTTASAVNITAISFCNTDTITGIATADTVTATPASTSAGVSLTVSCTPLNGASVVVMNGGGSAPIATTGSQWFRDGAYDDAGSSYIVGGPSNVHSFTNGGLSPNTVLMGVHVLGRATATLPNRGLRPRPFAPGLGR